MNQPLKKPEGKLIGVVSPPFLETLGSPPFKSPHDSSGNFSNKEYGNTEGNIGNLVERESDNLKDDLDLTQFTHGELYWHGCYGSFRDWKGYITPESFAHPAKMSPKLCDRIFKHLKQLNLIKEGDTVCDFMSGIGTTNVMASLHGLDSVGVELEPHFVKMQEANRQKCKDRGISRKWEILQGDSRKLSEILKGKGYVGVISPPYQNIEIGKGLNTLPPREGTNDQSGRSPSSPSQVATTYTDKSLVGVVSPPHSDGGSSVYGKGDNKFFKEWREIQGRDNEKAGAKSMWEGYNPNNPSNIGNLPDKKMAGVVSPPFIDSRHYYGKKPDAFWEERARITKRPAWLNIEGKTRQTIEGNDKGYSENKENIGNQQGESYLSAMLQVYQEAYKSGISPLATVTKNPTRKGKLRRLDIDTAKLLMLAGYEIYDYHRAMLFEEHQQATLTGDVKKQVKGRMSFFKRLSYEKGSPVAQWEDVIIAVIPNSAERESNMIGITSPPFISSRQTDDVEFNRNRAIRTGRNPDGFGNIGAMAEYGSSVGQIGILPDKPLKKKEASP